MQTMLGNALLRIFPWAAALIAMVSMSCGKADSLGPVVGYTKIDDMEGEGGRIGWPPPGGQLPGFWTSSTNCSQADRILPEPYFLPFSRWFYDAVPVPYATMPGVTSTHAARLRTKFNQPLQDVWGANMGFDFAEKTDADGGTLSAPATGLDAGSTVDGGACRPGSSRDFNGDLVDLGDYSGFTFWAMASPTGRQSIRVQVNDLHTDPRGGYCNTGPKGDDDCYNGFGKALMLTDTWAQYRVDFSELEQDPNWTDSPNAIGLDLGHVYSMNFLVALPGCALDTKANCAGGPAPVSFDVWIDDLYFVNRP
jgi:hypothetical protein